MGADLTGVPKVTRRDQALAIGRLGHETFGKLAALPVPSFAFTNGAAMGGGVEIGLYCTYRTISSGVPAVALPECFLGLVPGWGGCYLLPNLIGVQNALKVIIENPLSMNRMLKGPQAFALGMADAMFEPVRFLEDSLAWADAVLAGRTTVSRPEVDRDEQQWAAAVKTARRFVDQKVAGAAPAPYRALELVAAARTATRDEAFAAEDEALADLLMSDELRAGLYSFDLVQKRAKRPAGAPGPRARPAGDQGRHRRRRPDGQPARPAARPAPGGAGRADRPRPGHGSTRAWATSTPRSTRCWARAGSAPTAPTGSRRWSPAPRARTASPTPTSSSRRSSRSWRSRSRCSPRSRRSCSAQCVLATNTSSLSITEMAADLAHPERLVGFHFFNPVAVMPLLEIIRGERTDDATLATAFATGRTLKKTCILVKDSPSFIANRLLGRLTSEVSRVVDEGTPLEVADRAFGGLAPMPPFVLLGLVGPAIALHNTETLHAAFPERFFVSENLRRVVAAGKKAFYVWPEGRPVVDPEVAALLQVPAEPVVLDEAQVRERVLSALAQEARLMLDEGVVAGPQDLDLAMITGAGFSFWNGGITPAAGPSRPVREGHRPAVPPGRCRQRAGLTPGCGGAPLTLVTGARLPYGGLCATSVLDWRYLTCDLESWP